MDGENFDPFIVFEAYRWCCAHCSQPTPRTLYGLSQPNSPQHDHIVAVAHGGKTTYNNAQLLCRRCNMEKSDSLDWRWMHFDHPGRMRLLIGEDRLAAMALEREVQRMALAAQGCRAVSLYAPGSDRPHYNERGDLVLYEWTGRVDVLPYLRSHWLH